KANHDRVEAVVFRHLQVTALVVGETQTLTDILQSVTVAGAAFSGAARHDGVGQGEDDAPAVDPTRNRDGTAGFERLYPMINRILEQRLNRQARYQRAHGHFRNVPYHLQAIADARLLDTLTNPRQFELFLDVQRMV